MSLVSRFTQILVLGVLLRYSIAVNLTSSADSDVCPGDTVVFTCVTDTGQLQWTGSVNAHYTHYDMPQPVRVATKSGIFDVELVNKTGMILVSTATAYNVSLTDDGQNFTCAGNPNNPNSAVTESIMIASPPSHPLNVSFLSTCDETIITIGWVAPLDTPLCVHSYTVTINNSYFSQVYNTTDNSTSLNITDLTMDGEFTVTVAGIDGAGRLGENISEHFNLSNRRKCEFVSNLTHDQFQLGDGLVLLIRWSKQVDHLIDFYLIVHNVSSKESAPIITNNSNVAFVGVREGETYSVEISPFSEKVKYNSISKTILISAIFNMGPTMINKMCTVDGRIENTDSQWNITTGHIVAIFSSVFLIVIVMCYLMICLFVAATDNRDHHQPQHHDNRHLHVQEIELDELSSSSHESHNHEAEPNQDSDTAYEYIRHEHTH